jgi:hypothetical protein
MHPMPIMDPTTATTMDQWQQAQQAEQTALAQKLEADKTHVAVALDLAAVRKNKNEEIEQQLDLLTKYKDHLPEEEYEEKVAKLIRALPDPETYFTFTKTELPPADDGKDDEETGKSDDKDDEETGKSDDNDDNAEKDLMVFEDAAAVEPQDDEEEEEEAEEEEKKSFGKKMVGTVGSVGTAVGAGVGTMGHAMGSAMKGVKNTVTGAGKSKEVDSVGRAQDDVGDF